MFVKFTISSDGSKETINTAHITTIHESSSPLIVGDKKYTHVITLIGNKKILIEKKVADGLETVLHVIDERSLLNPEF